MTTEKLYGSSLFITLFWTLLASYNFGLVYRLLRFLISDEMSLSKLYKNTCLKNSLSLCVSLKNLVEIRALCFGSMGFVYVKRWCLGY